MNRMPTLFVSHGAPTYALEPGLAGRQLHDVAQLLPRPEAILIMSPHWTTPGVHVAATPEPATIHDFGGFDPALHKIRYPAAGHPALAQESAEILAASGWPVTLDRRRGLDHGAWVPLLHMFPQADVPAFQVSTPHNLDEAGAIRLGQTLAPMADRGVLIVGSGSLTHNLHEFRMEQSHGETYAKEFSGWIRQSLLDGDHERLAGALSQAPHARRAHPTSEHFLPLLVAAGAAGKDAAVTVLDGGIVHGVLSMESYVFGPVTHSNQSGAAL